MNIAIRPSTLDVGELLRRARELTGPVLQNVVAGLPEPTRTVARHHFGWRDTAGRPAQGDWGKGVRGALALGSAQACGGPMSLAVHAAAGVELVHNFSLLHDDLMDNDHIRRGRPTAWSLFGDAQAVLAGDALLVMALKVLITEQASELTANAVRELSDALLGLLAGQGDDLDFEKRTDVRPDDCLRMAAGKTASLFTGACALGAIAVSAEPDRVGGLRAFGHHVGLAFQLSDDVLGIWGDSAISGKPVGADLQRRKKSFPVVAALSSDTRAGRQLAELYDRTERLSDAGIRRATRLIEEAGGLERTRQEIARRHVFALDRLASVSPEPEGERMLRSIADLAMHRRA
ncbi:polyprenyl synthetase family protein [Streptomyces sp. HC44]|uniref:Polyprenyl synthetase family protein n=1 Tax=Streptomyces scabichelini TaxID=2711217 RepID=A0A6G4UX59_9ACTN|nr:polyprenyl synthetase family protein [Streptomyces scabichelini]NGO06296.1 polyprenyl synthetase family protein [Streptomyces scabichelini]